MSPDDFRLIEEARIYTRHLARYRDLDLATIRSDMTIRNDIQFCIVMLSEILKDMSPATLGLAPDIPASAIRGMRNRIIHRRHDVKPNVISDVVRSRAAELEHGLMVLERRLRASDA